MQRRSDIVVLGRPSTIKIGWLIFPRHKGTNVNPQHMRIPIFPVLYEIIDASETSDLPVIVTNGLYGGKQQKYSRLFTENGFGNFFRDAVSVAGIVVI